MNTNGSVTIEDGNPGEPGDFNPRRKVSVTIGYNVDEGEDGLVVLDIAAKVASAKVDELLGRKLAEVKGKTRKQAAERATAEKSVVETSAPGTDKAALEAAAGLTQVPVEQKKLEPVQTDIEDNIDDLLGDAAPVPITDAELAKAAQNKNAQMKVKDPNFSVKIRALVVEYAGNPPKKITDVPVAKRQEFLDKLRDLT